MKNKKILVTSGGTTEYIDDVRVLTNISSGKLGAKIAEELTLKGAQVYYVCGKNAVTPFENENTEYYLMNNGYGMLFEPVILRVKNANDAMEAMKKIITEEKVDAVIHCMAVSDFTFKRDSAIKCSSSDPEAFIEFMRKTITKNPKIIGMIKQWRPETLLVGFKFEVGKTEEELLALARASIEKNGCDLVIANDKKEMERLQRHAATFVYSPNIQEKFHFLDHSYSKDKSTIADDLVRFLEEALDA